MLLCACDEWKCEYWWDSTYPNQLEYSVLRWSLPIICCFFLLFLLNVFIPSEGQQSVLNSNWTELYPINQSEHMKCYEKFQVYIVLLYSYLPSGFFIMNRVVFMEKRWFFIRRKIFIISFALRIQFQITLAKKPLSWHIIMLHIHTWTFSILPTELRFKVKCENDMNFALALNIFRN